jgi:hypothetical protein
LGKVQTMMVDELEPYKDEELIIYCRVATAADKPA